MEDFYKVSAEKLSMSLRNFRSIIQARGWKNAKYTKSIGTWTCISAERADGKEIRFYYGTPPTMSYGAGMLSDDKYTSYILMKEIGIKQPETLCVDNDTDEEVIIRFIEKNAPVVIKPIDGAHGQDVYTGIMDWENAKLLIEKVFKKSFSGFALIQKQLKPKSYETRVICIDYKFVKAFARIPACVTGDGKHSVLELIDIENSTKRTAQYKSNLSYINKENAVMYLKKQALDNGLSEDTLLSSVPDSGIKVQVIGICNTGQGGTMEDVSDVFSPELKDVAERIAKHLHLPLVGVDFLDDNVIEVNKAPALYHPVDGDASTVCIEKFVDYLEKIPA
ncbi:hypothetical protein IJG79_00060 [Candidatus Saccharibacteria bacterium]|nr:hypothetical protein [Candidatus Saccharibacteria bacterium]